MAPKYDQVRITRADLGLAVITVETSGGNELDARLL